MNNKLLSTSGSTRAEHIACSVSVKAAASNVSVLNYFAEGYETSKASVTTRRTCFCVLSTCKNVGKRRASVRGEYHLRTESYGFGSTQTRRRTLSACNTFSTCGLRIYHPCVRVRATRVPRTAYERATYGLLYKDDLTGDCQLVSKMPRKAQKKSTRQDPKKRAAEDTRAASDDEVNRRCTHLQRASTACTRQRGNRTEIVRCKHVQLTYHLRNVRCTQPLTARRVVQTTYVHLASDVLPRPGGRPREYVTRKVYVRGLHDTPDRQRLRASYVAQVVSELYVLTTYDLCAIATLPRTGRTYTCGVRTISLLTRTL
ncbi:hypothetical protein Bbelb_381230 [Branchiostoma belcheri]|nr:hypothetical protein Bbelb_381230 [Branchiostoma belcheri]